MPTILHVFNNILIFSNTIQTNMNRESTSSFYHYLIWVETINSEESIIEIIVN